ncbi:PucR family transcriptional regulator [Streptomyces profundus]|uniref:PucR family transcriptional regulator n=1 Tax=Streptomyces profundus TaxID=2867410 RepID=UPI001D15FB74|nr:helix-turn-helix domain-containing protein [Streptomyces sp. MA3_2.13]UED83243.1 helix-turn-helix domain-containing protein [Streptomyces sp. MA3_2.13]
MSLQAVVEALGRQLGHPVTVYDTSMELIAYSAHDRDVQDIDDARGRIVLSRRASAQAVKLINRSGVAVTHRPARVPAEPASATRGRVVAPVCAGRQLLGYVAYIDDSAEREIDPVATRCLDEYTTLIAVEMLARERAETLAAGDGERLVARLVADDPAAVATSPPRPLGPTAGYAVLVVSADDRLPRIRRRIADVTSTPTAAALVDGDLVLVLTLRSLGPPGAPVDSPEPARVGPLLDEFRERGVRVFAGVGEPVPDLAGVRGSYRGALAALEAAKRGAAGAAHGAGVPEWDRVGAARLLLRLPLDALRPADLPARVRLLLAPEINPALAETVRAYLDHNGDARATARSLGIHRSTLYYRLHAVEDIIDGDLGDSGIRFELHLGLEVSRLITPT